MPHRHSAHAADSDLADLLDLDARVLGGHLRSLVDLAGTLAPDPVRTVVDLGAGTGVGSAALARRFGSARVVAVDRSAEMLDRTRTTARQEGVGDRLHGVQADLDQAWPAGIAGVDVVWASSSLHEVTDPDRLLSDVRAALAPEGLLVVIEVDGLPRVLPDDVGAGLGDRCTAALVAAGWNAHPDWRPHLERAGFEVVVQRTVGLESSADRPTTARFARAWLRHVRRAVEGLLPADDVRLLDRLLADPGPDAVLDRDLPVRGSRTAWAARPAIQHRPS